MATAERARLSAGRLTAALVLAVVACGHTPARHDATAKHPFDDVPQWVAVFDDPKRDAWQKPDAVIAALELKPGMSVADLGAGTGYFSRRLSQAVGPTGTVFAVDPEPNLVGYLRTRAEREHTDNVVPVLASFDNPRLPAGVIDLVLIVDTFHHIDDRLTYFRTLQRVLAPGGRVVVIDWQQGKLPVGPPPDHKLARTVVEDEMKASGYRFVGAPDVLPYQYFLVFTPEPPRP